MNSEAETLLLQGLTIVRSQGELIEEARYLNNLARIRMDCGDFATAIPMLRRSLEIKQISCELLGMATSLENLGICMGEVGEMSQAQRYISHAKSIWIAADHTMAESRCDKMLDSL